MEITFEFGYVIGFVVTFVVSIVIQTVVGTIENRKDKDTEIMPLEAVFIIINISLLWIIVVPVMAVFLVFAVIFWFIVTGVHYLISPHKLITHVIIAYVRVRRAITNLIPDDIKEEMEYYRRMEN